MTKTIHLFTCLSLYFIFSFSAFADDFDIASENNENNKLKRDFAIMQALFENANEKAEKLGHYEKQNEKLVWEIEKFRMKTEKLEDELELHKKNQAPGIKEYQKKNALLKEKFAEQSRKQGKILNQKELEIDELRKANSRLLAELRKSREKVQETSQELIKYKDENKKQSKELKVLKESNFKLSTKNSQLIEKQKSLEKSYKSLATSIDQIEVAEDHSKLAQELVSVHGDLKKTKLELKKTRVLLERFEIRHKIDTEDLNKLQQAKNSISVSKRNLERDYNALRESALVGQRFKLLYNQLSAKYEQQSKYLNSTIKRLNELETKVAEEIFRDNKPE